MYLSKVSLCLFLLLFIISAPALADRPVSWGDVSDEEWEMMSFPDDDEATAIILMDYGESYFDNRLNTVFRQHRRIKILDPDESSHTEVRMRVYRENRSQELRELRAHTLNRDENGEVHRERVRGSEIQTERDGEWEVTSFAFPDVRPGSIIEYSFMIRYRQSFSIPSWWFQHDQPIVHSEYRVLVPEILQYRVFPDGFETFDVNEAEQIAGHAGMAANVLNVNSNSYYRMVLKDAPAIRSEPFITTVRNYRNRVEFQITAYKDRRGATRYMLRTWDEVARSYSGMHYFGRQLRSNRTIRNTVNEVTDGLSDPLEIAMKLYDHVAESIVWNNSLSATANNHLTDVMDENVGNSAEKALLLTNMLRTANLDANPVLIASRDFGKLRWNYPQINQFNHVIVKLTIDDTVYMLDPILPAIPFGLLNPRSLNYAGFLITENDSRMISVDSQVASVTQVTGIVELDAEGNLEGQVQLRHSGYAGIVHRSSIKESDRDEYLINRVFDGDPDIRIVESSFENVDNPREILQTTLTIERPNHAVVAGDMMYVNPYLLNRITSNPFRNPVRNFPIEFPFGFESLYSVTITIPDGYEIDYLPEQQLFRFSDNTSYLVQTMPMGQMVQITSRLIRSDVFLEAEEYHDLRTYYDELVNLHEEQIVLRKTDESLQESVTETGSEGE